MGVYIPNMEKPQTCDGCPFVKFWCNGSFYCMADEKELNIEVDKRGDCPLIEIPTPHGRLIDGNWFIKRMKEYNPQTSKIKWAEIVAEFAPTILEAED